MAALAFLVLWPHPAAAQTLCATRDAVIELLARKYAEVPVALGMTPSGVVVELMLSATGSWTLLMSSADGISCALASGSDWTQRPAAAAAPGRPS